MAQAFNTIREFIDFLEEKDDLVRVTKEVDPDLEINAIIDKLARTDGPAVLFEKVKGSAMPVLGNIYSARRRVEWMLGSDTVDARVKSGINTLIQLKNGEVNEAIPVEVPRDKAPCKEVILEGDDVDLTVFPFVRLWPQDGGLYNTLPIIITRDPETGVYNVGIYRMMLRDKTSFCMHWLPQKHGRKHFEKAEELGADEFPVCVVMSVEPALGLVGAFAVHPPLDEYMVCGALTGKPVERVKAEDSDLMIPATAEIVFEGVVKTNEMVDEGPFGEFHGYYSPVKQTPVFHVRKITMKKDPLLQVATTGMPPTEIHTMSKAAERFSLYFAQKRNPNIVDFNLTRESGTLYTMIIALNKKNPGDARKMIESMFKAGGQSIFITNVIVVDGDVDVQDLGQVIWAWSCHCRPEHDVIITPVGEADLERPGTYPRGVGARMGIDATTKTKEEGYERDMPDRVMMDAEMVKKVEASWADYGFKK